MQADRNNNSNKKLRSQIIHRLRYC